MLCFWHSKSLAGLYLKTWRLCFKFILPSLIRSLWGERQYWRKQRAFLHQMLHSHSTCTIGPKVAYSIRHVQGNKRQASGFWDVQSCFYWYNLSLGLWTSVHIQLCVSTTWCCAGCNINAWKVRVECDLSWWKIVLFSVLATGIWIIFSSPFYFSVSFTQT